MPKNVQLDREAYAEARGRGLPRSEAAKAAGSRAKRVDSLSTQGARLEAEEGMQALIDAARDRYIRGLTDDWDKSQRRMAEMLDDPDWRARCKAAEFFGKVTGGFAPEKHEHRITTAMDLVEECEDA